MIRYTSRHGRFAVAILAVIAALAVAGCGGNNDTSGSASSGGNSIDRAFASEMVPHHQSAVAMAKIAREQTRRTEVKTLAGDIIRTQNTEIATFRQLDGGLAKASVNKGNLGLSEAMMGMSMDDTMLMNAKPFDREFIDMMVPHHQGAIRMARVELAKGKNAKLKQIAEDVVLAQSREITQMNDWRMNWYGAASPAGGVPRADETAEGGSMNGMSGHG